MFTFLNKRKAKRWCSERSLDIDLDLYSLVKEGREYYVISKGMAKLDWQGLNVVHIGLDARKIIAQSPKK